METYLTSEQESSRDQFLFDSYAKRSKQKGDYWFRQANEISGSADYSDADYADAPVGYQDSN